MSLPSLRSLALVSTAWLLACSSDPAAQGAGPTQDPGSGTGVNAGPEESDGGNATTDSGAAVTDGAAAVPDGGAASDGSASSMGMPTDANTGPAAGTTFADLDFGSLQPNTTYTGRRLINLTSADWPANVTLVDSLVFGSAGGTVCFNLLRVRWSGGIYVRQQPGVSCNGTIKQSSIVHPKGQALRPACTNASGNQNPGPGKCTSGWKVEDSYLASPTPGDPGQHLEAMQGLWDAGGFTFKNVNFMMAGPSNNTQTGDINWHGGDSTFTDCWFTGEAGFRVYAAGNNLSFIRPRIKNAGFGVWYPPHMPSKNPGVTVRCPMLLDGTPITSIDGAVCP